MRILLVNRHYGDDHVPTGRMLRDVAERLQELGHQVDVIATHSSYAGKEKAAAAHHGVNLTWLGSPRESARTVAWILFLVQAAALVWWRQWDRCVLLTDPPFLVAAAVGANLLRKKRPVYWWTMDLYPESLVAAGILQPEGLWARFFRRLNTLALRFLAGVISLDEAQKERLSGYAGWNHAPAFSQIVPPWDQRPFPPVEREANRFLRQFGLLDKRVLLYAGNLGRAHSIHEVIAAARLMSEQGDSPWMFVFVVRGARRAELAAAIGHLNNVLLTDYLPEDWTADLLWGADVHLITMSPGWDGIVVPSKLYGALQTPAPVLFIGPARCGTAIEIGRLKAGERLPNGSPAEKVIEAIQRLGNAGPRVSGRSCPNPSDIARYITAGLPTGQPDVLTLQKAGFPGKPC